MAVVRTSGLLNNGFPPVADIGIRANLAADWRVMVVGTVGGKVGLIAGLIAAFVMFDPAIALTPGRCLFEGGCGTNEGFGLAAAAIICLFAGLVVGVLVRALVNWIIPARD